jgi:small subunit ribosomal protein S16
MPVKIRLSKKGRKKLPYYHIVVADSRAPRDGKFVERIGIYNPQTNPATIELNFDRALDWLQKGAQPTDTCRAILSEQGVMMKKHLFEGAKKGAFSMEEAESRYQKWYNDKGDRVKAQVDEISKGKADESKKRLEAETKVKEAKAQVLAKKLRALTEEAKAEELKAKEPEAEELKAEKPKAGKPKAEESIAEGPKAEEPIAEEPKAEELIAEEPKAEAPIAEASKEVVPENPAE